MKTQAEIIDRIRARKDEDLLGFEFPIYVEALSEESAEFLRGEVLREDADLKGMGLPVLKTDEDVYSAMLDYMAFAWEKANNCRGISANRSIMHYMAWLFLIGEEEWGDKLMDDYEFYGKPQLVRICNFLGMDSDAFDDGVRSNTEY